MKVHFNLLIFIIFCNLLCFGDDFATGEWAWLISGGPATVGQTTNDHIFTRNTYNDMGAAMEYDNVISFYSGTPQLVWFWLDDNQIYQTDWVQTLPKTAYNAAGDLYNEITYSSFQFTIYVPQSIALVKTANEYSDDISFEGGPRLPLENIVLNWGKRSFTKVIDGITYDVYTVVQSNTGKDCTHFSSKNGDLYKENGALKKNDGALVGLYFDNKNQGLVEGRLPDIIIANCEFGVTECNNLGNVNMQRFIYGTGGNGETQRFQYYNRIHLYGSIGIELGYAESISLNATNLMLNVNDTYELTASITPNNANNNVSWTSSNTSIATVSANGFVTAVSPGTATITARTTDGSNLSATCTVTVAGGLSDYDNFLSLNNAEAFHGDTIVIPVALTNADQIVSFQTDIFLPEGLEIVQEDGEYLIDPSGRMTRTHSIMSNDVSNGAVRVICYSSNYKPLTGNSGDDLFYITVKVADNAEGDYIIQLKNTLFTTSSFEELAAPDVSANVHVKAYLLGDANNSGVVTVTDVVVTSQYVLEKNPHPFVFDAADVNFDNNITVTDVTRIAWMVLNPTQNAPRRASALYNSCDCMSAGAITLKPGETRKVSILLDNAMAYTAFQLDLDLPDGLTASNFQLTDRAGGHALAVNSLDNGDLRALCYSPELDVINGHDGALLTFDVMATSSIEDVIGVKGIELVTADCQTVLLDGFAIGANSTTSINEINGAKTIARVDYYNVAGQRVDRPESGVTLVVTTYTDGTRTTTKVIK